MNGQSTTGFDLVVHATHEAGIKMGGIGAVLEGLLSAPTYVGQVGRTILVGGMNTQNREEMSRLTAPRNRVDILYSSYHGIDQLDTSLSNRMHVLECRYHVHILYGRRAWGDARHEIILVDGQQAAPEWVNAFKARLYERLGIQSDRYEHDSEYNSLICAAEPAYLALDAVAEQSGPRRFIIAHEFMGLPLCYSAMLHAPGKYRTIFYGHEVATVRPIVEYHSGHDTMFYNVLAQARQHGLYLDNIFGSQAGYFKHGLLEPAPTHCDNILAVGDRVVDEMRFLGVNWARANIDLVYNGIPSQAITLEQKKASHSLLERYCWQLLHYTPNYVFTHVTRFVPSKGIWRDLRVMEHLDHLLAERNQRAVLFVLASVIPMGRPSHAVMAMEAAYGWPVHHLEYPIYVEGDYVPDLVAHEIPFYRAIEQFNQRARSSQIILINQFGWNQERCGRRMPAEMTFADLRRGADVEFGQSVYEPFGIAQVETLSFGTICVVSNVCGCIGFIQRAGGLSLPNIIVADYTQAGEWGQSIHAALSIDQSRRDHIEGIQSRQVAYEIINRLPYDDAGRQNLLDHGYALSQKMSWETVARDYFLSSLK